MEFHGNTWEMFHGIPQNSMSQYQTEFHGKSSMEPHGIPWGYFTRDQSSKNEKKKQFKQYAHTKGSQYFSANEANP